MSFCLKCRTNNRDFERDFERDSGCLVLVVSPQDVCRSVAAYHACVALHQQGFIDDDLNPTRTTQQLQVIKHR